ncbi:MAG: hypothetical protein ACOH5I_26575 [Oligoflexus sp.]
MCNYSPIRKRKTNELVTIDYWNKLSPAEKDWINRFNNELSGYGLNKSDALHTGEMKTKLHRDIDSRKRDIYTATPERVAKQLDKINNRNKHNGYEYYSPEDYQEQPFAYMTNQTDETD